MTPTAAIAAAAAVVAVVIALFAVARAKTKAFEQRELSGLLSDVAVMARRAKEAREFGHPMSVLVTGANSGIGFALCELLAGAGLRVILGCRSKERGTAAVEKIRSKVPSADIHLLLIDVSDPASVLSAVGTLKTGPLLRRTDGTGAPHLDMLCLNAGIMPVATHRWDVPVLAFLLGRLGFFFETGRWSATSSHFLQQPVDSTVACGAPSLFATHVLGHVMLAEECRDMMLVEDNGSGSGGNAGDKAGRSATASSLPASRLGRVIWTSSRAASSVMLRWESLAPPAAPGQPSGHEADVAAGVKHTETYGQAKHSLDLLNPQLARRMAPVPCTVICPGAVDSEMMPPFFKPFIPAFLSCRAYLRGFNVTATRGAHAIIASAVAPPKTLDPAVKYVTYAGELEPSTAGVWPLPVDQQERMYALVRQWLVLWREKAGAASTVRGGGAGSMPVGR